MLSIQLDDSLDTPESSKNEERDNTWMVIDFPKDLYQSDDIDTKELSEDGEQDGWIVEFQEGLYQDDDIDTQGENEEQDEWIVEFPEKLYQDDNIDAQESPEDRKPPSNETVIFLDSIAGDCLIKPPEAQINPPVLPPRQKQASPDWSIKEDRALIPNRMADDIKKAADIFNFGGILYLYVNPGFIALTDEVESIKRLKSIMKSKYWDNIPEYAWGICRHRLLTDPDIELDEKDRNKHRNEFLAVFANGVIFDSPKEIYKSKPEYMIFTFCTIEYHPKNRHKHNGVFDRFIHDISGGDEEIEDLLLCAMASMLLPSVSFKKAFMLFGRTHSGKSVIMWLLRQIIGGNNISAVNIQQFAHKHQLSEFVGKIANIRPDASTDTISSDQMGIFKSLVSGGLDVINATKKFSSDLTLHTDTFRMMFGFNKYPLIGEKDDLDAYLTRWIIVPFQYSKPEDEHDRNLHDKLMQEIDYIIFRILIKAKWLREHNFDFPECQASQQAMDEYRLVCSKPQRSSLNETADEFVMELCVLEKTDKEHISILHDEYIKYCDERGDTPMTRNNFKKHLCENYGLVLTNKFRKDGRNTYGLAGIGFRGATKEGDL